MALKFNMTVMVIHISKHFQKNIIWKKMKKHVIDISEELKGSRYLCKMKSIVETFFEYDGDHKNSKKKCLFIVLRKQLW